MVVSKKNLNAKLCENPKLQNAHSIFLMEAPRPGSILIKNLKKREVSVKNKEINFWPFSYSTTFAPKL